VETEPDADELWDGVYEGEPDGVKDALEVKEID